MPAEIRLLDNIFGIRARREHAIREPEEPAPQSFKDVNRRLSLMRPSPHFLIKTRGVRRL
jgi:hypothetical protein